MMKTLIALLLCLFMLPASTGAEDASKPAEIITAHYHFWETLQFVSDEVTLRVFDNGTSEVLLRFHYVVDQRRPVPDEPIIRLTKVDGTEGYYGEAPLLLHGENNKPDCSFSAVIPLDRALEQSKYLTFYICEPDGTQKLRLKCTLDSFDSTVGSWPVPESTPALPSIPPLSPTATPTMRPTLPPDVTVPPQQDPLHTANYVMREYTQSYTEVDTKLRIYPNDISTLTIRFKYGKAIPEGTVFRLSMVDGQVGYFGEGRISEPDAQGIREAVILINQQVAPIKRFNLEAFVPGAQLREFKAFYRLKGDVPGAWTRMAFDPIATVIPDPTATPVPMPADAAASPTPTIPPEQHLTSQTSYGLLDPVKHFSLKRAYHQRFDNGLSVLKLEFRYNAELPAKPMIRIVQREYSEGVFGEAPVIWEEDEEGLLSAAILTDQLQGSLRGFRLKCYDEKGNELFYADFRPGAAYQIWSGSTSEYLDYGAAIARSMLPTATPEPSETPKPTPTVAPAADPSTSPTPAPAEPGYDEARHARKFLLLDKVKGYAHYNVTLRRYEEVDVLTVYFRYNKELPEGTKLRLVRADTLIDAFGEALILPSELKNASKDLLCAKIPSDRIPLNCIGLRVEAVTEDGEILFTADFYPEEGNQAKDARELLMCEFEEDENSNPAEAASDPQ